MLRIIDNYLNKITMYRLVLWTLVAFVLIAFGFSFVGWVSYSPWAIIFEAFLILAICLICNIVFAWVMKVPANVESVYITALILILIIAPPLTINDNIFFSLAMWASVLAIGSKFILAIRKKHIFNPAAIAVVITAFALNQSATWWIGTASMLPIVAIGGFLIVRKIQRGDLTLSFLAVSMVTILISFGSFTDIPSNIWRILASTPLIFFATIMLTEPATTPPTRGLRIVYGSFVGFMFAPLIHIGSIYSTPELALVLGNIFVYIVSPKEKLILTLKKVEIVAHDTFDFIFNLDRKFSFNPGQYLEWTLSDTLADSRGNRRYFTIASSPTEKDLIIGVKFYQNPSGFKQELMSMEPGATIVASQRAGDFTLPKDTNKKLVFVAGGIGITPFRSMIKYLSDSKEKRDVILLYSNKTLEDVAYSEIFDEAEKTIGLKTVYTLTEKENIPKVWQGRTGYFNEQVIKEEVPDFAERMFFVSGPHSLVTAFEDTLSNLGVKRSHIKKDYFPGFA